MKKYILSLLLGVNLLANQSITICGTGDSEELLKSLGKAFELKYSNTTIKVPKSIGSGGGIVNTSLEKCDLGRVARVIKKHELKYNLNYLLFAYSPVVFVANQNINTIENLTTKDILGIYNGKINNWSYFDTNRDSKIYIARRESGDSSLNILNTKIQGYKDIKKFAGKVIYNTPKTVKIINKYKNTIGYLPMSQTIGTNLTIFNFNGVTPSIQNIKNGLYKLVSPFGLVYKNNINTLSKEFISFLHSKEADTIYKRYSIVSTLK